MSTIKCLHCGLVNFATDEVCKRCDKPLPIVQESQTDDVPASDSLSAKTFPEPPSFLPQENVMTKSQGHVLIGLLFVGLLLLSWSTFKPHAKYEYKVISFLTESNDRTGDGALKFASVKIDEAQIASMGVEGWDLVDSFLEMETAYPNFGKSEYVTGLQPNIRPQRVVLIFKRQTR